MKHNILSLDGGGTWALVEVKALMAIYGDITGYEVLSKFDLVVANSAGSIVLGALACNWKLSEILDFFINKEKREKIFVSLPWYKKITRIIGFGPKYSTEKKLQGLRNLFNSAKLPVGDTRLVDLPQCIGLNNLKIVIVGFDYDLQRAHFFRSDVYSPLANLAGFDLRPTLSEAVHASTNAPINYFNKPAKFNDYQYWDGGIGGYNNPVLIGVNELLSYGISRKSINVLSIGTGHVLLPDGDWIHDSEKDLKCLFRYKRGKFPQIKDDLSTLVMSILDDPPDAASIHAHIALTQKLPSYYKESFDTPIIRMNPLIRPILYFKNAYKWGPPIFDISNTFNENLNIFKSLLNISTDAMTDQEIKAIETLADGWIKDGVRNEPIKWRENEDLGCEIGYQNFNAAMRQWLKISS